MLADLDLQNPAVADRYAVEFEEKANTIALFPEIGRKRLEIVPTCVGLSYIHSRYFIESKPMMCRSYAFCLGVWICVAS